jgi:hypothetical protein
MLLEYLVSFLWLYDYWSTGLKAVFFTRIEMFEGLEWFRLTSPMAGGEGRIMNCPRAFNILTTTPSSSKRMISHHCARVEWVTFGSQGVLNGWRGGTGNTGGVGLLGVCGEGGAKVLLKRCKKLINPSWNGNLMNLFYKSLFLIGRKYV